MSPRSSLERVRTPEPGRPISDRSPVSSQLGMRVAVLGGLALVMFGIIFFRLWYLQILTGEQYVQQAAQNTLRDLPIAPPRGQILDREGNVLVTSKVTNAVQIVPSELPPKGPRRRALYRRLGRQLGMSPATIVEIQKKGENELPYAPVTIKTNAGRGVLTVLGERQNEYPGVTQEQVSVRRYPFGEMAAQAFGYVSQVTKEEEESRSPHFKGVKAGTIVGQEGLEYEYDRYLRGTPGMQPVEVNAKGQVRSTRLPLVKPRAGYSLRLTLDLGLQRRVKSRCAREWNSPRSLGHPGNGGAFVAMDPRNGQILAMGSYPSFNPNRFTKPLNDQELDEVEQIGKGAEGANPPDPLTDRATEGALPDRLDVQADHRDREPRSGAARPQRGHRGGQLHPRAGRRRILQRRAKSTTGRCELVRSAHGLLGHLLLRSRRARQQPRPCDPAMAHELGIGRSTGIDLPNESEGVRADAEVAG